MSYERLTDRNWRRRAYQFDDIYKRLAELEDKIEDGTLKDLPCKIFDTFYYIRSNNIRENQVTEISTDGRFWGVYDNIGRWFNLEEISFTEAEAEEKLKELRGEK